MAMLAPPLPRPKPQMQDQAPQQPPEAFVWGANGEAMSPEEVARQHAIAQQLMQEGSDYSPVGSWTQGAARVANALLGQWKESRANEADAEGRKGFQDRFAGLQDALNAPGADKKALIAQQMAALDDPYATPGARAMLTRDLAADPWKPVDQDGDGKPDFLTNSTGAMQAMPQTVAERGAPQVETARHNRVMEGVEQQKAHAAGAGTPLDPDSMQYAAEIYRRTGQMPPLGQGKAGTEARRELLRIAAAQAKAEGGGAAGDVANFADYKGTVRGLGALGTRTANIDTAAQEAKRFAELSLSSSAALPRGQFVPLNRAVQLYQAGTSSPELADFVTKAMGLANAAATVAGRGTTNQFLQEEYMRRLSAADGPEAFAATVKAITQEADAVVASTRDVHRDMLSSMHRKPGEAEAAPAPTTTPANGWSVKRVQ